LLSFHKDGIRILSWDKYFTMPFKDPEVKRANARRYYQENSEPARTRSAKCKRNMRAKFAEYKSTLSCVQCGENHPATLDFHHHTPHPDNLKINDLIRGGRLAFALKEIEEKCLVLCSNCHRKHHYDERKNKG